MSEAIEREALAILQRLEPVLGRIEERLSRVEDRTTRIEATLPSLATREQLARLEGVIPTVLPTLATGEQLSKLGYDLTWRFLSLLGGLLVVYLGAVWFVVRIALKVGVGG